MRAPETDALLRAWEYEDPAAWQRFRELLERSGLEPPATDLLASARRRARGSARSRTARNGA